MSTRSLISSVAAIALLISSTAHAQAGRRPAAAADPDLKELEAYTLTMDTLNKIDRANRAMIAALQKDPKYAERIKLGQELAALKKKSETTEADDKRIEDIEARIEKFDEANQKDDGPSNTLSDIERKINAMPGMAAALKQEGVTARDYAKFTMAVVQAGFALGAKQMTEKMGKPFTMPEGLNPANIKFVQEHEADIKKLQQTYEQANIK
jgi:chorismate mutase